MFDPAEALYASNKLLTLMKQAGGRAAVSTEIKAFPGQTMPVLAPLQEQLSALERMGPEGLAAFHSVSDHRVWFNLDGGLKGDWWTPFNHDEKLSHHLLSGGRVAPHVYEVGPHCEPDDSCGCGCAVCYLGRSNMVHVTRRLGIIDALWVTERYPWKEAMYYLAGGR